MENYKIEVINDFSLKSSGVHETEIPVVLLEAVREGLKKLDPAEGESLFSITPVMANPNLKELSFGVLEKTAQGTQFKFVVSIKTKEYWDDIFNRLKGVKQADAAKVKEPCPCSMLAEMMNTGVEMPDECTCNMIIKSKQQ